MIDLTFEKKKKIDQKCLELAAFIHKQFENY